MSSNLDFAGALTVPVTTLEYRDIANPAAFDSGTAMDGNNDAAPTARPRADVQLTEAEFAGRIRQEREQAVREAEQMIRRDSEQKLAVASASITSALKAFAEQRNDYFARVEAEVVQLALSIAAKILHREAQVDPMLVAALVRIAIEKMREGSPITVRVNAGKVSSWKSYFAGISHLTQIEVVADAGVSEFDCIVETELGSASFGLERQLKEIEQGFFDLLALRPSK